MRKKLVLVLLMTLAVMGTAWAESINESQANRIAAQFMAARSMTTARMTKAAQAPRIGAPAGSEKAAYYVFNADRGGYVIVAGDDRAPAVLGYSDKGFFDAHNVPEAMQSLLDGYAAQIEAIAQGGVKLAPQLKSGAAIRPMIKATWSQNNPYNILLPYLPSGKHAYAGCVATAMAQVMHYWQWPARPTQAIPAYTSSYNYPNTDQTLTFDMPALPVIDFNWDAMHDTYLTTDTASEAALAAATLTLYCAQAVEMNFKPNSSGANTTSISCKAATYFDYDAGAHMVARSSYTAQGWADLLYSELSAGRPVIFSGSKKTGGHAFICDGCDGNGMYHFNWGWNGDSNGYFLLSVLNPDEQGTGSASGAYGYILDQGAIIGFQPNQGSSHFFELTAANVTLDSYIGTRASAYDSFKVYVSGKFHNYTSDTIAVSFGWGLFENDVLIDRLYSANNPTLRPGYLHTLTNQQLLFGEGMTSGTYRIMPMYSEYGQNNWRPCDGADKNYIEVTINGNECTFTGYGTAAECDYVINDIAMTGYMHNGRPINFDVNMTNNGQSDNKLLYMFNNGAFIAAGYVDLGAGETGNVHYTYLFQNAGNYTLTWSWNEDGSDPIATRTITINPMPAANLSATCTVLNVPSGTYTINSDKFSVELTITNNGQTTYDEDISAKLYKNIYGGTGSNVQGINKRLTLGPGETTTIQLDLDNVIDGWKYFAAIYYYSEGQQASLARTTSYTMVFPEEPEVKMGDVNGDTFVNVSDVTTTIAYILGNPYTGEFNFQAADIDESGNVNVADVTAIIKLILEAGN